MDRLCKLKLGFICLVATSILLIWLVISWNSANKSVTASSTLTHEQRSAHVDVLRSQPICGDLPHLYPDSIPSLVHWTSKDGRVPARLQPLLQSWRLLLNASTTSAAWRFMHWDDKALGQLISRHYPQLASSYAKLVNGLERSDIGRLAVLHHVGGVYADMDVELRRDLSPWLIPPSPIKRSHNSSVSDSENNCCTAIWSQEPVEHALFLYNLDFLIANAVMLSRANHSFLSLVLREWPQWFEANWARKTHRPYVDATQVTGPLMLQAFYKRYLALAPADRPADWEGTRLADPDVFQPIWDEAYVPTELNLTCTAAKPAQLSNIKRRHCERLMAAKFQTKPVPAASFTVHRFLHLSYTDKMNLDQAKHISEILPILNCTV